jgi:hypothetical protein
LNQGELAREGYTRRKILLRIGTMSRKMLNHDEKNWKHSSTIYHHCYKNIEYAERTTASAVDITEHGAYFA